MNENLEQLSREELIENIKTLQAKLDYYQEEQAQHEKLDYAWTGNLGHWYWNVKENKVSFNALKVKALGFKEEDIPEEVDYQFFTDRLHPVDYEGVMNIMREHLSGKRPVYEAEYRIRAIDGSWKWFYDRGKITRRDEEGKPVYMAGIVFDITPKKTIEEKLTSIVQELKKENQTKNKFISVLAHDLRNPIGMLTTVTEMVRENIEQDQMEDLKFNLELIQNISTNTYELLDTLIQWAMAQEQAIDLKKETHNFGKLVHKVIAQQEKIAARKGIRIQFEGPEELEITTDGVMLSTVLRNLLSNALKFSHSDSVVEVVATREKNEINLTVKDNGIGMDEAEIKKLFSEDQFFKSRPGTEGEKGAGIGLNLCKNYTAKLGGKIWGDSTPGKGTSIHVRLPLKVS
jgi:PAS domain S-box-containing protein